MLNFIKRFIILDLVTRATYPICNLGVYSIPSSMNLVSLSR